MSSIKIYPWIRLAMGWWWRERCYSPNPFPFLQQAVVDIFNFNLSLLLDFSFVVYADKKAVIERACCLLLKEKLLGTGVSKKINLSYLALFNLVTVRKRSILLSSLLFYSILFYSILFYSILFYSILFYSILFYSILFYSILFYSILFYSILFYSILFYSILFYSILFYFNLL